MLPVRVIGGPGKEVPPERARTTHKKKGRSAHGGIARQNTEPARVAWSALFGRPLKKSPWPTPLCVAGERNRA
jgi:hypothetical protein